MGIACREYGRRTSTVSRPGERLSSADENLLLRRALACDPEALTVIHRLYYLALFGYALCRVNDPMVAEDIVSEVFARLLSLVCSDSKRPNSLRRWLFGVASKVIADHFRQHYRQRALFERSARESMGESADSPSALLEHHLAHEALRDAIHHLPYSQQEVLALRFGAGLSVEETATLIDKSEGAVKLLQFRALGNLRKLLETWK